VTRIYRFEAIDDALDLVPLAARRALDAAAIKISLEAWRCSPLPFRQAITALGAGASVDPVVVHEAIASANVPTTAVSSSAEPSSTSVPAELSAWVGALAWAGLTPLDRYALWKVAHGKHPEAVLPSACEEIAPLSTHVGARGEAHMVDVGAKAVTSRRAVARAHVSMQPATAARLRGGDVAKGDVLATARIAGIQAAKRTSELIPLCHVIALTRVTIELSVDPAAESEGGGVSIEGWVHPLKPVIGSDDGYAIG
jgi:molybdenum cofactor biosynthesis protein MoaC